jgi:hypothetical protein
MPKPTPQLENGYVRFATEWLEEFIRAPYNGSVKDFVLTIARETWGWNETWREISLKRLAELLAVSERRIRQLREEAARWNLIEWTPGTGRDGSATYRVQKDWHDWVEPRLTGTWATRKDVLPSNKTEGRTSATGDSSRNNVLPSKTEARTAVHSIDSDRQNVLTSKEGFPDFENLDDVPDFCGEAYDPVIQAARAYFCNCNPPIKTPQEAQKYGRECRAQLQGNSDFTEAEIVTAFETNGPRSGNERTFVGNWFERLRRERDGPANQRGKSVTEPATAEVFRLAIAQQKAQEAAQ